MRLPWIRPKKKIEEERYETESVTVRLDQVLRELKLTLKEAERGMKGS